MVCVREENVAGIDYYWRSIQKFNDVVSGSRFIPLRRNILPGWLAIYCKDLRSRQCCPICRVSNAFLCLVSNNIFGDLFVLLVDYWKSRWS